MKLELRKCSIRGLEQEYHVVVSNETFRSPVEVVIYFKSDTWQIIQLDQDVAILSKEVIKSILDSVKKLKEEIKESEIKLLK